MEKHPLVTCDFEYTYNNWLVYRWHQCNAKLIPRQNKFAQWQPVIKVYCSVYFLSSCFKFETETGNMQLAQLCLFQDLVSGESVISVPQPLGLYLSTFQHEQWNFITLYSCTELLCCTLIVLLLTCKNWFLSWDFVLEELGH